MIKSEADDKTILKGQSGGRTSKNASDDNGTCSTKSDEAKNRYLLNGQSQETTHKNASGDDNTCSIETHKKLQKEKGQEKFQKQEGGKSICIRQVKAGSSFVQLKVGNMDINARIDSGAEITILSSQIYEKLKNAPAKIKDIELQMADNDIQPLKMKLGNQNFSKRVHVASIGDDMLLGHDLLHHLGVCLDMRSDTLILNEDRIPITTSFKDYKLTVARVSVKKKVIVPPNSVVRLPCKMNAEMQEDYFIEPVDKLKVLMPRTVCLASTEPTVCLVNPSDSFRTLKKGAVIGDAFQEEDMESDVSCSNIKPNVSSVNQNNHGEMGTCCSSEQERMEEPVEQIIPEHLEQLYETAIENLNAEQQQKLKKFLCDHQDVFAKHDFDLGAVTAIQHDIDTGTAQSVKQRMRRTPACFVNEEEELLKKMLDAGVVRMGFGMTNSPATFSRVINLILRGLTWKTVLAFLDDILVMGMDFEDQLQNLAEAFGRFRLHELKLKSRKCILLQSEVEFPGRVVSSNQLKMATKDISTVTDWQEPTPSKEVQQFLGLANYHRSFIKNFADMAHVLYSMTGNNKFRWGNEVKAAFDSLKKALTNPPVLGLPNSQDPFILDTDASDAAIGAELIQVQNGEKE